MIHLRLTACGTTEPSRTVALSLLFFPAGLTPPRH